MNHSTKTQTFLAFVNGVYKGRFKSSQEFHEKTGIAAKKSNGVKIIPEREDIKVGQEVLF